jgi:hypothetical protein
MKLLSLALYFAATTIAFPAPQAGPLSNSSAPASICNGNTADTRGIWCEYSIDTDYYNEVPNTGATKEV